ncbi:nucleoside hydrolase [Alphaproteobacteria bacterium KMM 3653]|uniref:Nucleoside hydrolase n=1 Tax=Harenicola maris TaxID=2841044 RepID=A0AAP2CPI1_9RHOB|nr:nucleoside hydrolase [Harenicola maris]
MPRNVKMIIDTDPGIDDAMAIFYAVAAPEVEVVALTSIFGNVHTAQATRNALYLAGFAGLDVPVAQGAELPLGGQAIYPSYNVHGAEGLGTRPAPEVQGEPVSETAAMLMTRMAAEAPGEITLCALGPLTNVAAALRLDPAFARNIARIVVMGGSIDAGGNKTPHAEANIVNDPEAAAEVFASGAPVVMVGLDVTHRITCSGADFSAMAGEAPLHGGLLQDLAQFYIAFTESRGKFDGCYLHDPAAVIACTHPELFDTVEAAVDVELTGEARGRTHTAPRRSTPVIEVCKGVASSDVKSLFTRRIASLT